MPRKRRVELVTFGTLPVVLSEHIFILDYYIFLAFEIKKSLFKSVGQSKDGNGHEKNGFGAKNLH